jgi:uncharacterized membrane protein
MAQDNGSREAVERLIEQIEHLERVLQANTKRLHAIEQHLRLPAERRQTAPEQRRPLYEEIIDEREDHQASGTHAFRVGAPKNEASDADNVVEASVSAGASDAPRPGPNESATSQPASEGQPPPAPAVPPKRDLESIIGGSWFNWAGIIAFTFGVAFFLKHAFERQWIGPGARVGLGAIAGASILVFSDRLRARGYRQYAYVLSGGGILILYLSVYAAFNFYQLIGQTPAFLLMAIVTTTAVLLSVRHDALSIALLGLIGGFLTPILLSSGRDNQAALFTYIALLDAGVLALAYFKRWRSLDLLSFAGTVLMFFGWLANHYRIEKLWLTLFFLTVFFLMFSALALAHNVFSFRKTRWLDILLVIANATFYFGLSYALLDGANYDRILGSFALLLSAFFVLMFYAAWTRARADRLLVYSYAGAAVTFFTMAVAIQTDQHWVTIGWAIEALALTWVGLRSDEAAPRHAALAVFAVTMAHWFSWDMLDFSFRSGGEAFIPLLNRRALSCATLVGALLGAVWLYRSEDGRKVAENERSLISAFFLATSAALAFTVLTLDINDYFLQRLSLLGPEPNVYGEWIENARQFSLTSLWAFYATALMIVGLSRRQVILRAGALLLLAAAVFKVVFVDSSFYDAGWHVPVFNQTFLTYVIVTAALAACAWAYRRSDATLAEERSFAQPALVILANLFILGGASLEASGWFDRAAERISSNTDVNQFARLENGKAFALTCVWSLHASMAHWFGSRRTSKALRYGALALLALVVFKLLLWDVTFYDAPWRIPLLNLTFASFVVAVVAYWFVHRNYRRSPGVFDEELRIAPVLTVVGNGLAVVALSAEAVGYFASQARSLAANESLRDLELAQQLALSLVWALYGALLLVFGYVRSSRLLRVLGLVLLSLTTLKVFVFDLSSLDRAYRIVSFIVLGAILLAVSYLYQKRQRRNGAGEEAIENEY